MSIFNLYYCTDLVRSV